MLRRFIYSIMLLLLCQKLGAQTFKEVARESGIKHIYRQDKQMGGGAVFFDYDNDGWEDLYLVGGKEIDQLYKNQGDGSFRQVDADGLNITSIFYTTGVISGDFDDNGYRDLFVTTWKGLNNEGENQRNLLFMNKGRGEFEEAGLESGITEAAFSMGANTFDYDQDGDLDLYVINYVDEPGLRIDPDSQAIFTHQCFGNVFYENLGGAIFTEVSDHLGLADMGCALAGMPTDYDDDGDLDLYLANDFGKDIRASVMYQNCFPSDTFQIAPASSNLDVRIFAMGIAGGDIDRDGDLDYYLTNLGSNPLLLNQGNQIFHDIALEAGTDNSYTPDGNGREYFSTSWGTAFMDVNNDAWLDLFVANGRILTYPSIPTGPTDPNKLFLNQGDLTFWDVSHTAGIDDPNRNRGMAYCDYDKDGDLDILVVVQDPASRITGTRLYRNELNPAGEQDKNWIQLELKGKTVNKAGIGARVRLIAQGDSFVQEVHGQGSHCSQHSLVLHFGLGNIQQVDRIEIDWSRDLRQEVSGLTLNQRHVIVENAQVVDPSFEENTMEHSTIDLVELYPNPVGNRLYFNQLTENSWIIILSWEGREMIRIEHKVGSQASVDVFSLPKGTYICRIIAPIEGRNYVFVKN